MMKNKICRVLVFSVTALVLSACGSTGSSTSKPTRYFQIKELSVFELGVVGKTLWSGSNYVLINENRTWSGEWDGKKINGEWVWDNEAYCRTINSGKRDCQKIEISRKHDELRFTRDRGKGRVFNMWFERS